MSGYIDEWDLLEPIHISISPQESEHFSSRNWLNLIQAIDGKIDLMKKLKKLQTGNLLDDPMYTWRKIQCGSDHFVNLTQFFPFKTLVAYTLHSKFKLLSDLGAILLTLRANRPLRVWIDGKLVFTLQDSHHQVSGKYKFPCYLLAGWHSVLIVVANIAERENPNSISLRLSYPGGGDDGIAVFQSESTLEYITLQSFYLEQESFHHLSDVKVFIPRSPPIDIAVMLLDGLTGKTLEHAVIKKKSSGYFTFKRIRPSRIGKFVIDFRVKSHTKTHIERLSRQVNFFVYPQNYKNSIQGFKTRKRLILAHAAHTLNDSIFSEIARLELGTESINQRNVLSCASNVSSRRDCSDFNLAGLLRFQYLLSRQKENHLSLKTQKTVRNTILQFRYWETEPGNDAMCFRSENHQILFYSNELLASQLFPNAVFSNDRRLSKLHRNDASGRIMKWFSNREGGAFYEWLSNVYFEQDILALMNLVDFSENKRIVDLAIDFIARILEQISICSFKGVFGTTHGRTYSIYLKNPSLEPTSLISYLLSGKGCFNDNVMGVTALLTSSSFPKISGNSANLLVGDKQISYAGKNDFIGSSWNRSIKIQKRSSYMLSSIENHKPGQQGHHEHVWQATFDHETFVFTNSPYCISEQRSHRPGYWHGNLVLPKVVHYNSTIVLVYPSSLNHSAALNYTHAFFPIKKFDCYYMDTNSILAKKGRAVIHLYSHRPLTVTIEGPNAYRELIAVGESNIWICQLYELPHADSINNISDLMHTPQLVTDSACIEFHSIENDLFQVSMDNILINGSILK